MGLDIVAFSNATFLHPMPEKWSDDCDDHFHVYVLKGFEARLDGEPPGCYTTTDAGRHFRAGSYGEYNAWRDWLSTTQVGVEPSAIWAAPGNFAGRPFIELINFADNEGAIGPRTSAKLAEDFRSHEPGPAPDDLFGYWAGLYTEWRAAFEHAANTGFMVFR